MIDLKSKELLEYVKRNPLQSSKEIHDGLDSSIGYSTLKRIIKKLIAENLISSEGDGRGRKYVIAPAYELFYPLDVNIYFEKEIDEREIRDRYNLNIFELLSEVFLFSDIELEQLTGLQKEFINNTSNLTKTEYNKELERLAIDLSWKSSQIEGNTYSLLETERLLVEKETAQGKSRDEATKLLNHKDAIDFIINDPAYLAILSISKIEEIHNILIKELGIERNIRKRRVGISGTNYKPLDNDHQIREALAGMCMLVNSKESIFEKALLLLVLVSYIQPFVDENKRVARIISNAVLLSNNYCPLSFRTVDSVDYKKAMLLFYEQNNMTAFKKIFIDQFEFAVKTYF